MNSKVIIISILLILTIFYWVDFQKRDHINHILKIRTYMIESKLAENKGENK